MERYFLSSTDKSAEKGYGRASATLDWWRKHFPNNDVQVNVPFYVEEFETTYVLTKECQHPEGEMTSKQRSIEFAKSMVMTEFESMCCEISHRDFK